MKERYVRFRDYWVIKQSGLFDDKYYLKHNPDVRKYDKDPIWHYVDYGWKEGRDPSSSFSTSYYLSHNKDVAKTNRNPLVHYIRFGKKEGRCLGDTPLGVTDIEKSLIDDLIKQGFIESLSFCKTDKKPEISIIIPVYNHIQDTLKCLGSLSKLETELSYEIIIADDCSTDLTQEIFQKQSEIKYIRQDANVGFLKNCNLASLQAEGKYLVLLNNDTVVDKHWLNYLRKTFDTFPNVGLVGSKLVYPDGKLQEAGGVIWEDGRGLNYGRFDDPNNCKYNYVREVDYCSGASIMIRRDLWDQLHGFDPLFSPAYYEDTDLAFRVRSKGMLILFQPFSLVIHNEGTSSGTDVNKGIKKHQKINQGNFYSRWKDVLIHYGTPKTLKEYQYKNRFRKKRALIIDATTPTPDQDAGSIYTLQLMMSLRKFGYEVTFIPENLAFIEKYTPALQIQGIECLYYPYLKSIKSHITETSGKYDLIVLSRSPIAKRFLGFIKSKTSNSKVIFNTIDLHSLRELRKATIEKKIISHITAKLHQIEEIGTIKKADTTILVSQYEQEYVAKIDPKLNTIVLPLTITLPGLSGEFSQRSYILFLGGFNHTPNIDAVNYFAKEIWPLVQNQYPDIDFVIAGSNMPSSIKQLASENIKPIGFVEDLQLLFEGAILSVAPLRYGAGIKGKVLSSLSYGVPCVGTKIAVEGMGLSDGINVLVADEPKQFAEKICSLIRDQMLWQKISAQGLTFVSENYSIQAFEKKLLETLRILSVEN